MLDGLGALHTQNIAHRDIKPDNVIFVKGEPKIADIGLAAPLNVSMTVAGSIPYIPPEILGNPNKARPSVAVDLYASGKVLYCMFSGQPPENFPSPGPQLRPETRWLNELILKACDRRNPERRFKNTTEFKSALERGDTRKPWHSPIIKASALLAGIATLTATACLIAFRCAPREKQPENKPITPAPKDTHDKDASVSNLDKQKEKKPFSAVGTKERQKEIQDSIKEMSNTISKDKMEIISLSEADKKQWTILFLIYRDYMAKGEPAGAIKCVDAMETRWPKLKEDTTIIGTPAMRKKAQELQDKQRTTPASTPRASTESKPATGSPTKDIPAKNE